jgi:hypothetical protein
MIRSIDEAQLPEMVRPDLVAPDPMVNPLEPIAVSAVTACKLLSVSARTLDSLIERGLPVVKLPGKRLFPVDKMREWVAAQSAAND